MPNPAAMIEALIAREGGYVDHPDDRGGSTRYGITEAVARLNGWDGDMRHFPRASAARIYLEQYWTCPGFDRIAMQSKRVAEELMDTAVNMGLSVPTPMLQRALNALNDQARKYPDLLVDGLVGHKTLASLRLYLSWRGTEGEAVLLKVLNALQGERYVSITEARPANERFIYGWFRHRIGL